MINFLVEFEDELSPLTIGKLDTTTGTWTEMYQTEGYLEDVRSTGFWVVEASKLQVTHRMFLPNIDNDGKVIELDSTMYVVEKKDFDWDTDTEEQLYQVQNSQDYNYFQYATLESVQF